MSIIIENFVANTIREYLNEQALNETWYHGSEYKFDSFENFQSSGPSALGIFVTDDKSFAEMFGEYVYEVNIRYSNPYEISYDKWDDIRSKHAKDTNYFRNMRNNLISKGYDCLFIKERETTFGGTTFMDGNIVVLFDKSQIDIVQQ
jgi:hypothetical protein